MAKEIIDIKALASKVYGRGLWETVAEIAEGKVSNTVKTALKADADPRKLAPNTMHFQTNRFGDVQLVIRYEQGWSYAGILRNSDGEPIMSTSNQYAVREVKAMSDFKIPEVKDDNGQDIIIPRGFVSLKAYAL